ncbi:unnamed protein product [Effrenium voratum]|uniref:guanylate kinase n=1 Tax=Effrenium voratum TaxID=2562239 RepID=A0AA36JSV9_9DINO|nr:unnamed protein product [Effrenium voratum]
MLVSATCAHGVPAGSYISVTSGGQRTLRRLALGRTLRFPASGSLKLEVLEVVGSCHIVRQPGHQSVTVSLPQRMELEVEILPDNGKTADIHKAASSEENGQYLAAHGLPDYFKSLVATLLLQKPPDPFAWMTSQLTGQITAVSPAQIAQVRRAPSFKGGACVITGPSGVGKSTLIKKLMAEFPGQFGFSVSHTTRDPRPGEQDGVDYHFVSREQMQRDIDAGLFVEHAEVHGNLYGTSMAAVEDVTRKGRVCLLDIDVQGAANVRKSSLSKTCSFVFFAPPTAAVLEQRLRGRGTETEERIQKRLTGSLKELAIYESDPDAWDLTLKWHNEQVEDAYQEFRSFLVNQIPEASAAADIATVRRAPSFKGGACVITGPSGVGKSTLIKKLMAEFPGQFGFSVSHTTRDPRPGEQDGVDYHFVSREQMQRDIDAGLFVEHAEVHGNLYGTSMAAVEDVTRTGRVCLLDIDVQGAANVRKSSLSKTCSFVFFAPPTAAVLEQRLRGRGTETEDRIQKRLTGSLKELAIYESDPDAWDLTLKWYNEQVEDAYQEFRSFLVNQIPEASAAADIATVRRAPTFKGGACVITGPSGVGKSTLIKKLMAEFPGQFGFSVSHTTRDPRPGEQDGVDYHFVSREQMQRDIDAGLFVEHAEVHGNLYGTSMAAVEDVTRKGRVCLLDIDVQGAANVRKSSLSKTCSFVFFAPPTAAVLEQRLRGRGTETEERIQKRLTGSLKELAIYESDPDAWGSAAADVATARRAPSFKGGACVITGPSGVGKSTLIKKLMAEFPGQFGFSVSHTTRDPRPGEQDGVDYHFVSREQMQRDIDAGLFVEHAEVHGNLYGTSMAAVEDVTRKGRVCLLDIDVQGAANVRKSSLSKTCSFVFFAPPTAAVLEQRLRGRGTETEERIQKRLTGSLKELAIYESDPDAWDLTLKWYNEQVEDAYQEFRSFLVNQIPEASAAADIATARRAPSFKGGACVITGPSGVGKSTLIKKLVAEFPGQFGFSVSHTTRDPRAGEQDGVDYHFVSREQMQRDIDAGLFVEHAEVHGNLYGTSMAAVEDVTRKGRVCLLDIDVQGAANVRKSSLSKTCSFVFFAPPTAAVLEQRLRGRGTETEERIQKRLTGSLKELAIYESDPDAWDLTLKWYNEQVEDAYQEFRSFLVNQIPEASAAADIATVRRAPSFKGGACVITGPSGVGKSTLIKKLMAEFPGQFGFSVSHTTRDPRAGEQDGVDYHFVSREQMQRDIDAGLFVEHAEVHGNLYGTSMAAVEDVTRKGRVCLLDIDVQGAANVRKSCLSKTCSFVFFAPPTAAVLEQRLRGRGTETEERIQKRLAGSLKELAIYESDSDAWDLTLKWHNEQVEDAYQEFRSFLVNQIPEASAAADIATVRRAPSFKGGACVITGPSGVGKSTLIKKLMAEFPGQFGFSVSHTTRDPRAGEQDGVDYHFVSREQMQRDIDAGLFVEYAEVHGNLYGTSMATVQDVMRKGRVCLLDIDVQGAANVRKSSLSKTCSFVFFAPPTAAVLEQRLRGRGTETEERIQKRLTGSLKELAIYESDPDAWDLTLKWYNEQVEDAYQEFRSFLVNQIPEASAAADIATVRRAPSFKGGACVITGPSGVGKSTLIKKLMAEFPGQFGFSVSHTTRDPRAGEQDGVDYHFVSREQMQRDIDAGLFVEHAEVHGNLYGTSMAAVKDVMREGRVCLLDIDVQGAANVRKSSLSKTCSFVFFAPPTAAVLEQRLRGRGTETEERIQKRLTGSLKELAIYESDPDAWDLTLKWYNEQVEDAYQEFRSFLVNQIPEASAAADIATVRRAPSFKGGACVITGPSGVGKSTLIKKLMAEFPGQFGFSVSHTTRDPRAGEQDGVDYHFVSREQMQRDIDAGLFVEHAEVHGNLYGTSMAAVEDVMRKGRVCLLDIDVQGAANVRKSSLSKTCSFVFFAPPTAAVLEQRLRGRGTETEERIQKRLAGSLKELAIYESDPDAWDLTLKWYNEQVEDAYKEFRSFLVNQIPEASAAADIATVRRAPSFKGGACVITGPSGVGKSTLIKKLMAEFPGQFGFSVSHTTRDPRAGEQDGVDYHFVSREQMQRDIDAGLFVEHAEVHGNLYGTSMAAVKDVMRKGRVCLLDIDVQGAANVRKSSLSKTCSFVFFAPPTAAVLEQRLRGRGTETEERIQKRLTGSLKELAIYESDPDAWDLTLKWYNEQVEDAYQEFRSFLVNQIPEASAAADIATVRRAPSFKGGACVITGPSGVGKSTLIKKLMAEFPGQFGFSVSHTTRDPRPGEQDGVDYHFVSREQMQRDIDAGLFVEHAEVHGNLYGTSMAAVEDVMRKGRECLLDIDVQGAANVRKSSLSKTCSFVFFAPPTAAVLEQRLRGRGTETEEKIQKRLTGSLKELAIYESDPDAWDLTLKWYNEQVENAYQEFRSFLVNQIPEASAATEATTT